MKFQSYGPGFEDMRRRCPNIEKVRKLIGFEPKYDLEAVIQGVIDYERHLIWKTMCR